MEGVKQGFSGRKGYGKVSSFKRPIHGYDLEGEFTGLIW